jgi:MFS family permease
MPGRLRIVLRAVAHPRLRRLLLAYGLFGIADPATWIAVTVFAFGQGGVAEAGIVAVVQLVPATLAAPFAAVAGDRFRIDRVLAAGYVAQAVAMGATAAVIWAAAPAAVVYVAATAVAVAITFTRPAMGSVLPSATSTPTDLTAANVTAGVLEFLGAFTGPALAGLLLIQGPAWVFVSMAAAMAVAAVLVADLGIDRQVVEPTADVDAADVVHDTLGGFRTLRAERDLRLLVLVGALSPMVVGVTDVLFVVVADDLVPESAAGAGLLASAFGIGALAGAVGSVSLVGRARLAAPLAAAVVLAGVALLGMAVAAHVVVALVAFAACGAGQSHAQIAGASLVPRFAPQRVLSRVFGVVEALHMSAIAVGSLVVSVLVAWWGLRPALVAIGGAVVIVIVLLAGRLRRIDAAAVAPDAAVLRLVAGVPIFAGLGAPAIERLMAALEPRDVAAGDVVVRAGDEGDRFYLVETGRFAVAVDGRVVRELGPGSGFGEIALVRDVPRTATITTLAPGRLQTVRRADFLASLSGHGGLGRADAVAQGWLDDDASRGPAADAPG